MKVKELVNAMPRGCHLVAVDRNDEVLAEAQKPMPGAGTFYNGKAEAMEREVLKILTVDTDFMMLLVGEPESEGVKA